jgi:SAM-dependent methyltransferase
LERTLKNDDGKRKKLIDFAPSKSLSGFLKKFPFIDYRSADKYMDGVDDRVDLMQMDIYENDLFDIFICSHVLEHVDDDLKAMRELHRILKPGGWGIVMVPIDLNREKVYEDPSVKEEGLRWKHFGQNDHVRIYSKQGFRERLQLAGFTVKEFGAGYFGAESYSLHGIHPRSVLYTAEK